MTSPEEHPPKTPPPETPPSREPPKPPVEPPPSREPPKPPVEPPPAESPVPPGEPAPPPPEPPRPPVEPPPGAAGESGGHASAVTPEARQMGMFAHLSALLGGLLTFPAGGGWGCFIGPLIIWLIKKDTMPFVDDQGKEALNFNITVAIAIVVLGIFSLVTFGIGLIVAVPLGIIIGVTWLVLTIVAAVKANEGVRYRYPLTLRLIK